VACRQGFQSRRLGIVFCVEDIEIVEMSDVRAYQPQKTVGRAEPLILQAVLAMVPRIKGNLVDAGAADKPMRAVEEAHRAPQFFPGDASNGSSESCESVNRQVPAYVPQACTRNSMHV
jgi:hypothetical protein